MSDLSQSELSSRGWSGRRALSETTFINVLVLVLGAITGVITARTLGADGRGVFSLAVAVGAMVSQTVALGLTQAFAYTVAVSKRRAPSAALIAVLAALIGGTLAAAIGLPLTEILIGDQDTETSIQVALVSIPLGLIGVHLVGVFQGLRIGRAFNAIRISTPLTFAVLLAAALLLEGPLTPVEAVVVLGAAQAASAALALAFLRREKIGMGRFSARYLRRTLRYGLIVGVDSIAWQANRYVGLLAVGVVGTLTQAGVFSVGLGYAAPVGVAALAIALHTLPDVSAQTHRESEIRLIKARVRQAVIYTLPLTILAVAAAPWLLPFAYGAEFEDGVVSAQILVLAQALLGVAHVMSEASRGMGYPGLPAIASVIGTAGAIAAMPALLPAFGLVGAAIGTTVAYLVMLGILGYGLSRHFR